MKNLYKNQKFDKRQEVYKSTREEIRNTAKISFLKQKKNPTAFQKYQIILDKYVKMPTEVCSVKLHQMWNTAKVSLKLEERQQITTRISFDQIKK